MSIFMQFEGIKGEVSDKGHKAWLDVANIEWAVERRITAKSSTRHDRESANAEISSLILFRRMDSATPKLFIESCCGTGKTVIIRLTKTGTGEGADVYMEYTLKNALITKYRVLARGRAKKRPVEILSISFSGIEMKYTPYDQDGNALAPIAVGFDVSTNTRS